MFNQIKLKLNVAECGSQYSQYYTKTKVQLIMPQYDETFLTYHADIERKGLRSYQPNKKNRKLFLSQHVPQLICHSIYELIEKCESGFFVSYK